MQMRPQLLAVLFVLPNVNHAADSSTCPGFVGVDSPEMLRDQVMRGMPFRIDAQELTRYAAVGVRGLLPEGSLFNVAVSPDNGFYNAVPDSQSPLGLSRIWPYMLEDVPYGRLVDIMAFSAKRARYQAQKTSTNLNSKGGAATASTPPPARKNPQWKPTKRKAKLRMPRMPDMPPHLAGLLRNPANHWYINGQANQELFDALQAPPLDGLVRTLSTAMGRRGDMPDLFNLWLSGGGTVSNLHFDPSDNWMCQLKGAKNFTMYAPEDSAKLYPVSYDHRPGHGDSDFHMVLDEETGGFVRIAVQPGEEPAGKIYAAVNNARPDVGRFPRFAAAAEHTCRVEPGQCIHIPRFWWHNVAAEATEVNLSLNFWFDVDDREERARQKRGATFDLAEHHEALQRALHQSMESLGRSGESSDPPALGARKEL